MGPLIPQGFVNPDLNLFFAFVIGLGFGYVLEQGGFSNSRKLAGVFYGYDFVVLRVFFTAAITAAIGLLLFNYMGWVNYDLLYINPTFLWSALVGGAIMGFGFILGGFCPGTSMVAAVIGKIDAMVFVLGLMIGVFIFGSFYEDFLPLYTGENLGSIFIFDTLGMSRDWFVFLLVLVALAAFIVTRKIEDKVNGLEPKSGLFAPLYVGPVLIMLVAAIVVLWLPDSPRAKWFETDAETVLQEAAEGKQFVQTEELAYKLLNPKENDYLLVDVRGDEAFAEFTLPGALHIPADKVLDLGYNKLLSEYKKPVLFFGFSDTDANQAWMSLRRTGISDVFVLKGGLNQFFETIFFAETRTNTHEEMPIFEARFIERAREAFQSGEAAEKINVKAKPITTIVEMEAPPAGQGGC
ncbi:MAG: YeeE/YedE thiosulfate transporter family protein [Bacteroidales bacterium]|jgi:uncharacterized membrane protein YedE/YeeE/rhodanese-related sulfurtransferase|nr:YeeE/YedE thiosulfate transporter family protein [Bacteroidales bacterium]